MSRNILLATDLTARGDRPFDRAGILADQWQADQYYAFVNSDKSPVTDDKVTQQLRLSYGELINPDNVMVAHGKVPEAICKMAEARGADIIVLGAARYNNITDFFLGTAVDYVVRHTKTPVLVVKERPRKPYQHILVAVDFSEISNNAVRRVLDLFPDTRVTIAHAYHLAYEAWLRSGESSSAMRDEAEQKMQAFVADLTADMAGDRQIETRLLEGSLHQSIFDALGELNADLLALGTHGRSGFMQATMGSRASELMGWSPVDVLMVRS